MRGFRICAFPESSDKILVEQVLGRTDSKGQFVLPVAKPDDADADGAFAQAQSAEEAGDLSTAESLYRRIIETRERSGGGAQSRQSAPG